MTQCFPTASNALLFFGKIPVFCRLASKYLPHGNGVRKVIFSIMSVCQSFCSQGVFIKGSGPIQGHPSPFRDPLGHVQTCSTWTSLYRDPPYMFNIDLTVQRPPPPSPPTDMLKLVKLGPHCTGIPPPDTCSNLFNFDFTTPPPPSPSQDIFKPVQYVVSTFGKRVVGIYLKSLFTVRNVVVAS